MGAFVFNIFGWFASLRPIVLLLRKIKNRALRGLFLEIHYLILSGLYVAGIVFGLINVPEDTMFIALAILSIIGIFSLNYAIVKYHKDNDMNSEEEGYEASTTVDGNIRVRSVTRDVFSPTAIFAFLTAPLAPIVRPLNMLLSIIPFFNEDYVIDLAIGYNPNATAHFIRFLGMYLIDIVYIEKYCK